MISDHNRDGSFASPSSLPASTNRLSFLWSVIVIRQHLVYIPAPFVVNDLASSSNDFIVSSGRKAEDCLDASKRSQNLKLVSNSLSNLVMACHYGFSVSYLFLAVVTTDER